MPRPDPITSMEVYVTAAVAYPAFERLFLSACAEIIASFRVFDRETLYIDGLDLDERRYDTPPPTTCPTTRSCTALR